MRLWAAFPSSLSQISDGAIDGYAEDTAGFSLAAIERSVSQFRSGLVPEHNADFVPSAPRFVANVRAWQEAMDASAANKGLRDWQEVHGGILEVDFGRGKIDLRGKAREQIEWVLMHKRMPETDEERAEFVKLGPALHGDGLLEGPSNNVAQLVLGSVRRP